MLRIVFVGTFSVMLVSDIRMETVGSEISVTSVRGVISAVSVLFVIGIGITKVVCVWDWKQAVKICGNF